MNFKCSGDNLEQIPEEVIRETGIAFPGAHTDKVSMVNLAQALRKHKGDAFVRVPFCVTVEAEAFGATIKLGNAVVGPRVEAYRFSAYEEMRSLQRLDLTEGRIKEVLDAVAILSEQGEKVALSVEGPFTILSSLIDPLNLYKGLRKDPQLMLETLKVIEEGLIRYALEGIKRGASIISYADQVGAMDIVGPKVYREYSGPSSHRIISGIRKTGEKVLIHLCGLTSTALEKMEMASAYPIEAEEEETYGQSLIGLVDHLSEPIIIGHKCIKWSSKKMDQPVLWGIELK